MNSIIESLNQWGGIFLSFSWPMLWQSSLLIAVLFAVDFLFRRRLRASIRYALWLVVLVKLCVPPTLALPTSPAWWLHQTPPPVAARHEAHYTVTYDNSPLPEMPQAPLPVFVPPKPAMTLAAWLLVTSAAVSLALLGWLLVRWWQVARMVRGGVPAERFARQFNDALRLAGTPISLSARFKNANQLAGQETSVPHARRNSVPVKIVKGRISPAVCGLFRPVILIPHSLAENFSDGQLRAVLLHELIHLRRRDVWVNFLQALLQIFYWWHPLVWLANARIRRVREEAVDDAVMLALRDEAETYAPTLLEVAKLALNRPLASLGLVGIMESRHALRQRIERLVDFRPPRRAGLTLVSLLGILAFTAVAVPMGEGPAETNNPALPVIRNNLNQTNSNVSALTNSSNSTDAVTRPVTLTFKIIHPVSRDELKKLFLGAGVKTPPTVFYYTDDGRLLVRGSQEQLALVNRQVLKQNGYSANEIAESDKQFVKQLASAASDTQASTDLYTRKFILDTNTFAASLQNLSGVQSGEVPVMAKSFFKTLGVDLELPGKSIYYGALRGELFVRATLQDYDTIEKAISMLNSDARQTTNVTKPSAGRQAIMQKLKTIRLDRVAFDAAPLTEVIRSLSDESKKNDPDRQGINYVLNSHPKIDPSTGSAAAANAVPAADLRSLPITISPALTNITLGDALDALVIAAPKPIQYSIVDYGIIFRPGGPAEQLYIRDFKVDPNTFVASLKKQTGLKTNNLTIQASAFFSSLGVDLNALGKRILYEDGVGRLLVRATVQDLDTIERAIQVLNERPPMIHIKARFIEVTQDDNQASGFDWYMGHFFVSNNVVGSGGGFPSPAAPVSAANPLGNFPGSMTSNPVGLPNSTSAAVASVTGILTDTNYRFVLHALSSRSKPEILGEPEITTTSGRRTIMKPTTIVSVITNFTYQETATNSGVSPQTENLEVGPILDSTASVLSDGYMIDLDLKASYSEFLGYDKPTLATTAAYTKAGVKIDVPNILPRIETRQASAHMNVRDGQTVVLGGLIIPSIRTTKEKVPLLGSLPGVGRIFQSQSKEKILKNLMVFVTATIVDPAGNRIHTDAEMPFAQKGSPPQPPQPK